MKTKDTVIKSFGQNVIDFIRDKKNITIYVWKYAIHTWDDIDEFVKLIELNNINVVYFEDRENYLDLPRWVISNGNGSYWTGNYAEHPFGGRARLFLQSKCYAKKYFSKESAIRAAETMKKNGVFGLSNKYSVEEFK